ncbi:MAG: DUF116 domain-containing protein [Bacteroidetes bacterium]|nr:DUF116 domain-containing protein [Bacteroidota bacterium]
MLKEIPVKGKTYSLFGISDNTDAYYDLISDLTESVIKTEPNLLSLISEIDKASTNKRFLRNLNFNNESGSSIERFYLDIKSQLAIYISGVQKHLKDLSIFNRIWDKSLSATEEQYYLSMLKIELVNRLHKKEFNKCENKIALLPHCLRDLTRECKSQPDDFDYLCKSCSKDCFINEISKLLLKNNIKPYIWMSADLKKLFKDPQSRNKSLGVLGIACIPELESGMRKCMKSGVPVLGLPLNANRCRRWFGEFYPNSINFERLKKLIIPFAQ